MLYFDSKDLAKRARAARARAYLHAETVCHVNGTHFSISIPFHILPMKGSKKARVGNSGYFIFVFRLRARKPIASTYRILSRRNTLLLLPRWILPLQNGNANIIDFVGRINYETRDIIVRCCTFWILYLGNLLCLGLMKRLINSLWHIFCSFGITAKRQFFIRSDNIS